MTYDGTIDSSQSNRPQIMNRLLPLFLAICLVPSSRSMCSGQDPLPSWNHSAAKSDIISFVRRVTEESSPDFVPPAERIATFDNDGCLWSEKPVYFQLLYAIDRIKSEASKHPEWERQEPFASVLKGEMKAVAASGEHGLMQLIAATHAGMSVTEFSDSVSDWMSSARHPTTGKRYTEMVFQPMLELLQYLRANGFKTYIVSGGGIEFIRPWAEATYGIPPEQVVGSSLKMSYDAADGEPKLMKLAEVDLINDKSGKPVGIQRHIGRRPIFAAGNSDGDFQMLEWTTTGTGLRFGLLIHHTDADREWAYDKDSPVGKLSLALEESQNRGWSVVDMAKDWNVIYPK